MRSSRSYDRNRYRIPAEYSIFCDAEPRKQLADAVFMAIACLRFWLRNSCWSGDKGTRTPDLLGASEALSQLSYIPEVGLARLELAASRLSGVRSNQLSYSPKSYRFFSCLLTAQ